VRVLQTRDVIRSTPRTRIIRFELGSDSFSFMAGQAVMVGLHDASLGHPYSIACSPRQAATSGLLELLVQIDDTGAPDPHLERLTPGDRVDVEGPFGTFGLPLDVEEHDLLFVAGGTGIAPLRSMIWDVIERNPSKHIALIYSVRSPDEFAYQQELEQLAAEGRVDVRMTVTREGVAGWLGPRGRIDAKLVQSVLKTTETRCAICGPPAMVNDVTGLLTSAGISSEKILMETFAA
jgi:ferredoxin-NADP reductase